MTDAPETDATFLAPVSGACVIGASCWSDMTMDCRILQLELLLCVPDVMFPVVTVFNAVKGVFGVSDFHHISNDVGCCDSMDNVIWFVWLPLLSVGALTCQTVTAYHSSK